MDTIDQKIIRELQANGRLTNQELSEKVGLSPSPCLRRVKALEHSGVLTGYTALVDQDRYGVPLNIFVSLKLERQTDKAIRQFEEAIGKLDDVLECYLMTGTRDYLMRVVSQSLKTYEIFVREKLSTIPGISSIESSFALGQVKRSCLFPPLSHFK